MRELAWIPVALGGVAALGGGLLHTVTGLPMVEAGLAPYGVDADTARTVRIGWLWGGLAMDALGAVGVLAALDIRHRRGGRAVAVLVGLTYALFAVGALALSGGDAHFVFFLVVGLLFLAGATLAKSPRAEQPQATEPSARPSHAGELLEPDVFT